VGIFLSIFLFQKYFCSIQLILTLFPSLLGKFLESTKKKITFSFQYNVFRLHNNKNILDFFQMYGKIITMLEILKTTGLSAKELNLYFVTIEDHKL
jgi:hypothetical protein